MAIGITVWDGDEEAAAAASVWNGAAETAATVRGMPTGFRDVDAMLAATPFYIAHRGGSVDWPEMSLRGMTESVARGAGALEVSLARTSDGVWFGLHDETFDRTAGQTGTLKPEQLTWSQVQNYSNRGDRYYRLEELVEPWASSHVFFIDPKYNHQRTAELFPKLNAMLRPEQVVIKYFGDNWRLANAARAAGYKSWGYFYTANFDSGMYAANKDYWDFLGLPYDAPVSYWNTLALEGKPMIAHIAPNLAAANMGLARGAAGVMVSGIRNVLGIDGL